MNTVSSCLLLLFLASFVTPSTSDVINWRYKQAMSVLMDIDMNFAVRHKRQILNSIDVAPVTSRDSSVNAALDTARACAKRCEDLLAKSIMNETHVDAIESPFSILKKGFNISSVDVICQKFNESEACFTTCDQPSSSLGVYQLICGERKNEFIQHLPCYQTRNTEPKEVFERKCGGPGVVFSALFSNPSAPAETSIQDIGKVLETMRPMCKFLKCAVDFTARALDKRCKDDPKAGKFFREIGMAGARTALGALEAFDEAQQTHLLPSECNAIINPKGIAAKSRQVSKPHVVPKGSQRRTDSIVAGLRLNNKKQVAIPVVKVGNVTAGEAAKVPVLPPVEQHTLAAAFQETAATGENEKNGEPKTSGEEGAILGETISQPEASEKTETDEAERTREDVFVDSISETVSNQETEQPAAAKVEGVAKIDVKQETQETENGEVTKDVVNETKETVIIESVPSAVSPDIANSTQTVEELQKIVLRKQLNVLTRTEAQLELEMKKLQLEIDLLAKKASEKSK